MAGGGLGMDDICADPQFNFLSFFSEENDDDAVPDSFFTTNHCSPYSNINLNCNYISNDDFSTLNMNQFTVLSLNIQSLAAKFGEFSDLINEMQTSKVCPDILCLQETWNIVDNSMYPLPNYHPLLSTVRTNARGGGVAIYVKQHLSFKILSQYSIFLERIFESLIVEITLPSNKKIVIGSIYRPPTTPGLTFTEQFRQFSETLSGLLAELSNNYEHVFLYGGFNLNVLEMSKNKFIAEYIDTIFSYGFLQLVTKPTRVSGNTATLIDHILTNSSVPVHDTFILCSKLSDHFPIIHQLNFAKIKLKTTTFQSRNFSPENLLKFKRALKEFNWDHVTEQNCAQEAFNNFSSTFDLFYNLYFPITTKTLNKNYNSIEPWMSSGILVSRKQKNLLCKQCINNPSALTVASFKRYRNLYNQVIRTAKKLHIEKQLLINQKNLRKTWQILFSAIHKDTKKTNSIPNLVINNIKIGDPLLMATHFNEFFTSIAEKTIRNLNPSNKCPTDLIAQVQNKFKFSDKTLTKIEILNATKLLLDKKTPDHTGVSTHFIKKVLPVIVNPLHHIFSLSFTTGTVPTQLKLAKVIPIFKSGEKSNMDNYRPISLLSSFSKILEKIVSVRLCSFLETNKILSKWQFGFRSNHSTVHPLVHFLNNITDSLNTKKHSIAIFCDLKKAFDTCDRNILLNKLQKCKNGIF